MLTLKANIAVDHACQSLTAREPLPPLAVAGLYRFAQPARHVRQLTPYPGRQARDPHRQEQDRAALPQGVPQTAPLTIAGINPLDTRTKRAELDPIHPFSGPILDYLQPFIYQVSPPS